MKDEATAFCLNIEVGTSIRNGDVGAVLKNLIARYGRPKAIRSDNVLHAEVKWSPGK